MCIAEKYPAYFLRFTEGSLKSKFVDKLRPPIDYGRAEGSVNDPLRIQTQKSYKEVLVEIKVAQIIELTKKRMGKAKRGNGADNFQVLRFPDNAKV